MLEEISQKHLFHYLNEAGVFNAYMRPSSWSWSPNVMRFHGGEFNKTPPPANKSSSAGCKRFGDWMTSVPVRLPSWGGRGLAPPSIASWAGHGEAGHGLTVEKLETFLEK